MEKNLVLIIDAGNSQISFGLFVDDKIVKKLDLNTKEVNENIIVEAINNLINKKKINGSMICSVVPRLNKLLCESAKKVIGFEPTLLKPTMYDFLSSDVDDINEVGGDLIADVISAKKIYGSPCLIVDLGTVTKNILIGKKGELVGVSFYPGIRSAILAMSGSAELLPDFEIECKPKIFVGHNTKEAMETGVYYATLGSIISLGQKIKEKYGENTNLILTGGFSNMFAFEANNYVLDVNLTLVGVYELYKRNLE